MESKSAKRLFVPPRLHSVLSTLSHVLDDKLQFMMFKMIHHKKQSRGEVQNLRIRNKVEKFHFVSCLYIVFYTYSVLLFSQKCPSLCVKKWKNPGSLLLAQHSPKIMELSFILGVLDGFSAKF